MSDGTSHNHLVPPEKAGEYYIVAPVEIPTPEQMTVKLVPLHLMTRLEVARSDGQFWGAVFWAVVGALFGIVCNWATSDPINITTCSLVVMAILVVVGSLTFFGGVRKYHSRAQSIKAEVTQAGVNLRDRELESLRRRSETEMVTILSGKNS